jgi:tRNA pseudouridine38-40 synthase
MSGKEKHRNLSMSRGADSWYKMIIEYDGSGFSGWQIQPEKRTIQGEIERALKILFKEDVRIRAAGRTDAGVHALGQVASFQGCFLGNESRLCRSLNGLLPPEIRIIDVVKKGAFFDARAHAIARTYRYQIGRYPQAVGRDYIWTPYASFTVEPMRKAADSLLGEHDFTSFCKADTPGDNLVSRVLDVQWLENSRMVIFEIKAIRFFHNMVRIIVGTLMDIGWGKRPVETVQSLLDARDRKQAGPTAPAKGLFLYTVHY